MPTASEIGSSDGSSVVVIGAAVASAASAALAGFPEGAADQAIIARLGHADPAARGIVRTVIDLFGVSRCMFASNFPVDSLCASFATIFGGFRDIVADLPADAQRALFRDNAIRIYAMP